MTYVAQAPYIFVMIPHCEQKSARIGQPEENAPGSLLAQLHGKALGRVDEHSIYKASTLRRVSSCVVAGTLFE
jgi:hypothetical protein